MNINGTSVMLTEEDRNWIKLFFQSNTEFIESNSLIEYENIAKFADLYDQFLDENDLKDNDVLMLFLAELRYEQLSYKITTNSNKMKMRRKAISVTGANTKISGAIQKWYEESHISSYVPASAFEDINRSIQPKIEQNRLERQRSWQHAKDFIVK